MIREKLAEETGKVEDRRNLSNTYDNLRILSEKEKDLPAAKTWYEKSLAIQENLNTFSIIDESGLIQQAELIDVFSVTAYPNNMYAMYSFGELIDDNNKKVYISRIVENEEGITELHVIEDEEEWILVNRAVNEIITELDSRN